MNGALSGNHVCTVYTEIRNYRFLGCLQFELNNDKLFSSKIYKTETRYFENIHFISEFQNPKGGGGERRWPSG